MWLNAALGPSAPPRGAIDDVDSANCEARTMSAMCCILAKLKLETSWVDRGGDDLRALTCELPVIPSRRLRR